MKFLYPPGNIDKKVYGIFKLKKISDPIMNQTVKVKKSGNSKAKNQSRISQNFSIYSRFMQFLSLV